MTNEERKAMDVTTMHLEALYESYLRQLGESDKPNIVALEEGDGLAYENYLRALGIEQPPTVNLSADEYQAFVDELGAGGVARRARQHAQQLQRDRDEIAEANEKHREEMLVRGGWE